MSAKKDLHKLNSIFRPKLGSKKLRRLKLARISVIPDESSQDKDSLVILKKIFLKTWSTLQVFPG